MLIPRALLACALFVSCGSTPVTCVLPPVVDSERFDNAVAAAVAKETEQEQQAPFVFHEDERCHGLATWAVLVRASAKLVACYATEDMARRSVETRNAQPGCRFVCPRGFLSPQQRICRYGEGLQFENVTILRHYKERNADGTIAIDRIVTRSGDYPSNEIDIGTCEAAIATRRSQADGAQRGHTAEEYPTPVQRP